MEPDAIFGIVASVFALGFGLISQHARTLLWAIFRKPRHSSLVVVRSDGDSEVVDDTEFKRFSELYPEVVVMHVQKERRTTQPADGASGDDRA